MIKKMILVVVIGVTLAGCQSNEPKEISNSTKSTVAPVEKTSVTPQPTPIPQENALKGYLYTEESGVLFISWTEQEQTLNGTMQRTSESKNVIVSESYPFTGVLSDKSVSLNFQGGLFNSLNGKTITGVLDNDSLILYFPNQKDGSLMPASFTSTDVNGYNDAVSVIKNKIEESKALASKQKEVEKNERAIKNQQSAVESANKQLSDSIQQTDANIESNKNIANGFDAIFQSYEKHWGQMKKHKQDLINAAKVTPFNYDQLYIVNDKLYILSDDEYQIQDDAYQIGNMEYDLNNYSDSLKKQEDEIKTGWDQLQTATLQNSAGTPLPKYTEDEVKGYLENIKQELTRVESTLQAKKKSASEYDEKAKNLLQEMTDYVNGLSVSE